MVIRDNGLMADLEFWVALQELVQGSRLVLDRPKGTSHPRYPDLVYPLDYGYLEGTTSIDGNAVDVWAGSLDRDTVTGVVATVDLTKRDTELKILIGCTKSEMETIYRFHNSGSMKAVLIERQVVV
jgi:inorganic pyrophosphatase